MLTHIRLLINLYTEAPQAIKYLWKILCWSVVLLQRKRRSSFSVKIIIIYFKFCVCVFVYDIISQLFCLYVILRSFIFVDGFNLFIDWFYWIICRTSTYRSLIYLPFMKSTPFAIIVTPLLNKIVMELF